MLPLPSALLLPIIALSAYALKEEPQGVKWKPCTDAINVDCGSHQVPLDYAHPELGNATLALVRVKACNKPRLGSVFFNPGGPGESGTSFIKKGSGQFLVDATNGQYDVVSWDPRGVNQTKPLVTCGFTSEDELIQFMNSTLLSVGIEARGNFTDQGDLDNLYSQLNVTDSNLDRFWMRCAQEKGDPLKYVGTAAFARDMVSVSDCLEGPGKSVNYYGISYGTVVGNYFVNMFPERVGRVVIDGVADSITWATEASYKTLPTLFGTVESTFAGFTQKCAEAGPRRCPLARNDSTPDSIGQSVRGIIDTVYDLHKAGDPKTNRTAAEVRSQLFSGMYSPKKWTELASSLVELNETLFTGKITAGRDILSRMHPHVFEPRQNSNASVDLVAQIISQRAIVCGDSIDQDDVTTKQVFDEVVRVTHEESPLFGETMSGFSWFACHRSPVRAVERFTGPFDHVLANPILVIGNKADPITPFANAKKIADTLGNSARLLKHNGFGHTSLAEDSNCTRGVIRDYFLHGNLPSHGKVCEVNQILFPPNATTAA